MEEEIDVAVRSIEEIEIQNSNNRNIQEIEIQNSNNVTAEEIVHEDVKILEEIDSDPDYVPEAEVRGKSSSKQSICHVCQISISSKSLTRHLKNQHNYDKKSNSEPYNQALRQVEKRLKKSEPEKVVLGPAISADNQILLGNTNKNSSNTRSNKNGGVFTKSGFTYEDIVTETENDQNAVDGMLMTKHMCCICNRKFSDLAKFNTHLELHR